MKFNSDDHYYYLNGTIRGRRPHETISWIEPHLSKLGITRLADITGLDTVGIPTFISIRPNAKHLSVSQGKGVTKELAQVSALMEALEVYHVENPPSPAFFGSYAELSNSYKVIESKLFNCGFFAGKINSDKKIAWAQASNLMTNELCYIPHALVSLNSSVLRQDHGMIAVTSNGLASGNSFAEAVCHGLFEVVERDCLTRWGRLNVQARQETQINLASVKSPVLTWLINCFQGAGIFVKVWDVSSQIGIPAFNCMIQDQNELRGLGKFTGSGAHLAKEVALARALTEAAQSRLTLISGSRDDVFPEHYQMRASELHALDSEMSKNGEKDFSACREPAFQNGFAENITDILERLRAANFKDVFVVDHTNPEFNVPVVQVFVAGLFHGR
jgi:YcaO-like protein with predicted kinase domain